MDGEGEMIQKLLIRLLLEALVEAVMKIHKITNFQAHPMLLLLNGKALGKKYGKKEVQNQRTHMSIKDSLIKTTFLCQNFLKKTADYPLQRALQKPLLLRVKALKPLLKKRY